MSNLCLGHSTFKGALLKFPEPVPLVRGVGVYGQKRSTRKIAPQVMRESKNRHVLMKSHIREAKHKDAAA